LIVLDRDGVINEDSDDYIKSPDEWRALPGSLDAIARLNAAGWRVVVATNQSGVGRGLFSVQTLDAIHDRMKSAVADAGGHISGIYVCPHRPDEGCRCRKPRPGLLERIGEDFGIALAETAVVGDKLTDVLAAQAVGARPLFVASGGRDEDRRRAEELGVDVYADIGSAVEALLRDEAGRRVSQRTARDSVAQPLRQWLGSIAFTTFLFLSVVEYAPNGLRSAPVGPGGS
jgi:D-glycero-D-manno-heptose 1,7-bisphosphate phosphatase